MAISSNSIKSTMVRHLLYSLAILVILHSPRALSASLPDEQENEGVRNVLRNPDQDDLTRGRDNFDQWRTNNINKILEIIRDELYPSGSSARYPVTIRVVDARANESPPPPAQMSFRIRGFPRNLNDNHRGNGAGTGPQQSTQKSGISMEKPVELELAELWKPSRGVAPNDSQRQQRQPQLPQRTPPPTYPVERDLARQQQHHQRAPASPTMKHRNGAEEVPIHSQSNNDYEHEWGGARGANKKRVDNIPRNPWNRLRGMWGKRAISDRLNNIENFKRMLLEARDLNELGEDDARDYAQTDDDSEMEADGDRQLKSSSRSVYM